MSLLKLKAKVLLTSEDQMEVEESMDLGTIAKSKNWVWKNIAIPFEEVYEVIEYNTSKSIVKMYNEEKILVAESFEEVYQKWNELRVSYGQFERKDNEEGETTLEE